MKKLALLIALLLAWHSAFAAFSTNTLTVSGTSNLNGAVIAGAGVTVTGAISATTNITATSTLIANLLSITTSGTIPLLYGSTASAGNLNLRSTTHGTLGTIIIGNTGAPTTQTTFTETTGSWVVGGTIPNSKSLFTVATTTLGSIPAPRHTTAQRTGITSPPDGLQSFDTTIHAPYFFDATRWWRIGSLESKGQATSAVDVQTMSVPESQLTQISAAGGYLVETGNQNILANPSFEHSTFSTSWTSSAGTAAVETSTVIHGAQSYKLSLSAQAMAVTQSSTSHAAQYADGIQGYVSIRAKTTVAGIQVCSINAGSVSTTNCVSVPASGKWQLVRVPFVLGGTSNGISINSNAVTVTGDVYLDNAYVAAGAPTIDVNTATPWQAYTPTLTGVGTATNVDFEWRQNNGNVDLRGCYTSGTPTGVLWAMTLPNSYTVKTLTVTPQIFGLGAKDTGSIGPFTLLGTTSNAFLNMSYVDNSGSTTSVTAKNGNSIHASSGQKICFNASVPVNELQSSISSFSTASKDTGWLTCTPTSGNNQGFGTLSNVVAYCKRQGSNLLYRFAGQAGSNAASEARIGLPVFLGVQLTSSSAIATLESANGTFLKNAASASTIYPLIEPSKGYITFGRQSSGNGAFGKDLASNFITSSETFTFTATVPIQGWEDSSVITGTFKESVTVAGINAPKWFGFLMSSTGTISGAWGGTYASAGACSSGNGSFTLSGLTSAPKVCHIGYTASSVSMLEPFEKVYGTTSVTFKTRNSSGSGACVDMEIDCVAE